MAEINTLATEKLGFEVNIQTAYKLCDFKPVYGFLFQELIGGFDFWAHADIDLIFGDIRHFITNDILALHDVIAVRHDFLTGYFTLFRNNPTINMLFAESRDYKKVLASSKHYCFDETNFMFAEFTKKIHYSKIESEVESMTHVVKKMHEKKVISAYFDFHVVEGAEGKLRWNKGKLIYNKKFEAILYHLILFKLKYKPDILPREIPDSFFIGKTQIMHG